MGGQVIAGGLLGLGRDPGDDRGRSLRRLNVCEAIGLKTMRLRVRPPSISHSKHRFLSRTTTPQKVGQDDRRKRRPWPLSRGGSRAANTPRPSIRERRQLATNARNSFQRATLKPKAGPECRCGGRERVNSTRRQPEPREGGLTGSNKWHLTRRPQLLLRCLLAEATWQINEQITSSNPFHTQCHVCG